MFLYTLYTYFCDMNLSIILIKWEYFYDLFFVINSQITYVINGIFLFAPIYKSILHWYKCLKCVK